MEKKNKKWYYILGSILFTVLAVLEALTGFLNNSFQIFDRMKPEKKTELTVDSIKVSPIPGQIFDTLNKKPLIENKIINMVNEAKDYKNGGFDPKANSKFWEAYNKLPDRFKNDTFELRLRNQSTEVQNNKFETFFINLIRK